MFISGDKMTNLTNIICWDHRKKEQKCVLKAIKAVILSQITWKRFSE
jgi:hypothetical protein